MASVGKSAEGRPAIELSGPADEGFGQNRAVIGVGHHHQSLTFCRKQDEVALVANILSTFHEDQGAGNVADGRSEPIRTAILRGLHLPARLRREKQPAFAAPGAANQQQEIAKV